VVIIPCHNEEEALGQTLADLPVSIPGVAQVETLVIDDGSTDSTQAVARERGASVIALPRRGGLAVAFRTGIAAALARGADIIVNTDGDNQYCGRDVAKLVAPIVAGQADMVVGARPIEEIASFSAVKKWLQRAGTAVVNRLSGVVVGDATSGFRALSRQTAMIVNVHSRHTYTLETLIQAGQAGLRVQSVPINVNPVTRPSRLIKSTSGYVVRSALTMLRCYCLYRPFRFFVVPATLCLAIAGLLGARFLVDWWVDGRAGHVQSLILASILFTASGVLLLVGILGELLAANRRLLEESQSILRQQHYARVEKDLSHLQVPAHAAHGRVDAEVP
jgi:glycosyltransferase involved in cell wall biosynthesis